MTFRTIRLGVLAAFLLGAAPCTQAPRAVSVDDSLAIDSLYIRFRLAYAALDAPAVAALYSEDALYGSGGAPRFQPGRQFILRNFDGFFTGVRSDSQRLDLRFRFVRRFRTDSLAADAGYYWLQRLPASPNSEPSIGKFGTVMRPDSLGRWHFVLDSYSDASLEAWNEAPPFEP